MKIKITKPDGSVIEADGTAEECGEFAMAAGELVCVATDDSGGWYVSADDVADSAWFGRVFSARIEVDE